MKAIIEFNLDDEMDSHNYELMNATIKMQLVLWEYDQKLRSMYKYEGKEYAAEFRDMLREMLIDKNINHLI
jgi:predicted AlkP superfamily phosphohydrolase/phosphomutase